MISGGGTNTTYTPDADWNGTDNFTYTVGDWYGGFDTGTVEVIVTPVNDAPVANDDSYTTDEDTTLTVNAPGILSNDNDVDDTTLTAELLDNPNHGTLTLNPDGSFVYTPYANYYGTDSFTYKAYDGEAYSNIATVTITINSVNDAPVADFSWEPQNPTDLDTIQFIDNSSDLDGTIMEWYWDFADGNTSTEQNPQHQYADNGTYTVTLTVRDDDGATNTTTKQITVANIPPNANFTWAPETPTDLETIQFTDLSTDSDGTIVSWHWDFGDGNTSTEQNHTHRYGNNGIYTITLTIWDDDNASDTISKQINVSNVPPVADFTWNPETPNQIIENVTFTSQSIDPDGTIINYTWDFGDGNTSYKQNPTHGYADNRTYTVTLTVTDDDGATNTTSKQITISNVAPTAVDDYATIDEDTSVIINVSSNDYDEDGNLDLTSIVVVKQPLHGSTTVNTNGTITYTPDSNYYGYDEFNYTIKDNDGAVSNTACANITINSVNDDPVANDDYTTTDEDTPVWINIVSNDYDIDGTINISTISIVDSPSHGSLDINYTTGEVEYIPDSNYYGSDSFNYTVNDNDGATSNAATM